MSKPVLFATFRRRFCRAENLMAIYNAYHGDKAIISTQDPNYRSEVLSGRYDLMVIDDFPYVSPGKCIMIWHAIHGGKTIGYDKPGTPRSIGYHRNIDYIITGGTGTVGIYHYCTDVERRNVLPYGLPRTDAYVGRRKGDGHTQLAHRRAYLYAPTFRDIGETPLPALDLQYIDSILIDDELFVVKPHPDISDTITGRYRHIIEIPNSEPSTQYLIDCDVVITDYSSIMFDGFLLGKPCVLFEKNPGYLRTRGMCFNYPRQYSSRYATTEHDMIRLARSADTLSHTEQTCRDLVAGACDGHACERLVKLIDDINK